MSTDLTKLLQASVIHYSTADGRIKGRITGAALADIGDVAYRRQRDAVRANRPDKHGFDGEGLPIHYLGAACETAAAGVLGVAWSKSVNTFKAADIQGGIQVRGRAQTWHDLIVRTDDSDAEDFVHVTADLHAPEPVLYVRGYINGRDAKQDYRLARHGGREPAYFVLVSDLKPISALLARITADATRRDPSLAA